MKHQWIITNGELGTLDNTIVRYSTHPNGIRALGKAIQQHANRTRLESWAIVGNSQTGYSSNRYYPKRPE